MVGSITRPRTGRPARERNVKKQQALTIEPGKDNCSC